MINNTETFYKKQAVTVCLFRDPALFCNRNNFFQSGCGSRGWCACQLPPRGFLGLTKACKQIVLWRALDFFLTGELWLTFSIRFKMWEDLLISVLRGTHASCPSFQADRPLLSRPSHPHPDSCFWDISPVWAEEAQFSSLISYCFLLCVFLLWQ